MVPIPLFREDHNTTVTTPHKVHLKVNKDSHVIRKQQQQQPSPNNSSGANKPPPHRQQQNRHPPVIIYTQSPKVIHTQPQDFMALVQKLTGYTPTSASDDQNQQKQRENKPVPDPRQLKPTMSSYYNNLDEYESKKRVVTGLISNNFNNKVETDESNDNNSSNNTDKSYNGGIGGSPGFFLPPIFDHPRLMGPSASFPFFSPSFDDICCPNNNITTNNYTFFNNQISSSSGSGASFIYLNDVSSPFDATSGMCMRSSSSSMEAGVKNEF